MARLLREVAEDLGQLDRESTKEMLSTLVDQIALDPRTLECQVHYRIGLSDRNKVASPRGHKAIPVLEAVSNFVWKNKG